MSSHFEFESPAEVCEKSWQKKVLYFSDGTLEVNDEDDAPSLKAFLKIKSHSKSIIINSSKNEKLTWIPWIWHQSLTAGIKALEVCDYVGEALASFFGITTPKYQFEINEYFKKKKEEEVEKGNEIKMRKFATNVDTVQNVV